LRIFVVAVAAAVGAGVAVVIAVRRLAEERERDLPERSVALHPARDERLGVERAGSVDAEDEEHEEETGRACARRERTGRERALRVLEPRAPEHHLREVGAGREERGV